MRRWLVPLLVLGVGCESDGGGGPGTACVPGRSSACVCTDGASGAQVCASNGSGYDDCVCTSAPAEGVDVTEPGADVASPDGFVPDAPAADAPVDGAHPGEDASPGDDAHLDDAIGVDGSPDSDLPCQPHCAGRECGDDDCGGSCGTCPVAAPTCVDHACHASCVPDCVGKACGPDGCGGQCGACDDGDPDTVDTCNAAQNACAHVSISDCPVVAVLEVEEPPQIIPQTVLHLHGENSFAGAGSITKFQWSVEQPALSSSHFVPNASYPSPTFEANVAGTYVFHLDVWDEHGQKSCFTAEQKVFVIPEGGIHVELLWTSPGDPNPYDEGPMAGIDLDLHFAHPNAGQPDLDGDGALDPWFDPSWDTFWFYPLQNWGSVSSTSDDARLDRDDVDGLGPENINLQVPEGGTTYAIGVNCWDDHGFGSAFATVRVYVDASLVYEATAMELVRHDLWWAATLAWPGGQVSPKQKPGGGTWLTHDYHHAQFYQP